MATPQKKKKILQLCYRPNATVAQFDLFEEVVNAFDPAQYEITYALMMGEPDPALVERMQGRAQVHFFQFRKRDVRGLGLQVLLTLKRFIAEHGFDIIISHRYKPSYYLYLLSPFLKTQERIIVVYHGLGQLERKGRQWLARFALDHRWRLVAVSNAVREDLIHSGIRSQQVVKIANAVDIDAMRAQQLSRAEARQALNLPDHLRIIATIGITREVKGHRYLIDAFAQLADRYPDTQLLIIGGGPLEDELRAQASRLGLSERVTITGLLPNAYRYIRACDLFLMSSLYEGLPIALLEAMAGERPVMATAVGGIPEALGDQALLVKPQSADALAQGLDQLLAMPATELDAYASRQHQHLRQCFAIERYHADYRRLTV